MRMKHFCHTFCFSFSVIVKMGDLLTPCCKIVGACCVTAFKCCAQVTRSVDGAAVTKCVCGCVKTTVDAASKPCCDCLQFYKNCSLRSCCLIPCAANQSYAATNAYVRCCLCSCDAALDSTSPGCVDCCILVFCHFCLSPNRNHEYPNKHQHQETQHQQQQVEQQEEEPAPQQQGWTDPFPQSQSMSS